MNDYTTAPTLKVKRRDYVLSDELAALDNPTLARILAARHVSSLAELETKVQALLPAQDLLGLSQAIEVLDTAIDCRQKILVVGDFDCDGATSTALVVRALRDMGAVVDFIVPDRFVFGYGLTPELMQYAYDAYTPNVVMTVDNGISSHEGVNLAQSLGVQVVVTDHHLTTEAAPAACAVVNPNQLGCGFGSKALVGVGVAFYVMGALAKWRKNLQKTTTQVSRYLDLVALGTIADVGVLDQNNRILVAHGLSLIQQGRCCQGILALLAQAGRNHESLRAEDLGFVVAPRINAAGRMDNMRVGVECLLCDEPYAAQELAQTLSSLNQARRQVEGDMRETANAMLENLSFDTQKRAVILYDDTWHQGVIGIVAGRIKEKLYLPTFIFAPKDASQTGDEDLIKASGRSIKGVHLRDTLVQVAQKHPDLIVQFGGHAMAAGLTIVKKDFDRFCQAFWEVMAGFDEQVFLEEKLSDGSLSASDVSLNFAHLLDTLTVWGNGFAKPAFDGVFSVLDARVLKEKHLKLKLGMAGVTYPIEAIWFGFDAAAWDYRAKEVHILYTLDINHWRGNQHLQFVIQDLAVVD